MKNKNLKYIAFFTVLMATVVAFAGKTGDNILTLGKQPGASSDKKIIFDIGAGSANPFFKWDSSASHLQFSDDGSSIISFASSLGGNPYVTGTKASPLVITAAGGITLASPIVSGPNNAHVKSNGGSVTVTKTPSITACTADSQTLVLQGEDSTDSLILQSEDSLAGSGLTMPKNITLGKGGIASFICDSAGGKWRLTGLVETFPTATGGTITQDGDYEVHSFYSSGTFTITSGSTSTARVLTSAGAGGGGSNDGGGGGGGGTKENTNVTLSVGSYSVVVGTGGLGGTSGGDGTNGTNTSFTGLTTMLGGGGGSGAAGGGVGLAGGSGGGVYYNGTGAGAGTAGQGFAGGSPGSHFVACDGGLLSGGGGGGATSAGEGGQCPTVPTVEFAGGAGLNSDILVAGSFVRYGCGGNAGYNSGTPAASNPCGGNGGANGIAGTAGNANSGGGGGGSGSAGTAGGPGGTGVVHIRIKVR